MNGDWTIGGRQVLQNEQLTVDGQLRILNGGTLVLRDAVLEVNDPRDSFDPYGSNTGTTSIYVEAGGSLQITNSFVVSIPARAMMAVEQPTSVNISGTAFVNVEAAFLHMSGGTVEGNTFSETPGHGLANAILLSNSSGNDITQNSVVSIATAATSSSDLVDQAINLLFSDDNDISANTLYGAKGGIALYASSGNTISNDKWDGPPARDGEAGIGLQNWSNNNIVSGNVLENAGSAVLFVLQSKNEEIASNTIRNVGLGVVLRWSSDDIVTGNTLEYVWDDAIRAYRSYSNSITNNTVHAAGSGIGLYSSWSNDIMGNKVTSTDRGLYLFDAQQNQVHGNDFRDTIQTALAVGSTQNTIEQNNFVRSPLSAGEDASSDVWKSNFWQKAPPVRGGTCAAKAWPMPPTTTPTFHAADLGPLRTNVLLVARPTVWDGQTETVDGGITVQSGASLVIRDSAVAFDPQGMEQTITLDVQSGASLEIDSSTISGPDRDHPFMITIEPGGSISMKNSKLQNAGSWVGAFGAAIAYQGSSADIENNTFTNVYCAFSSEEPASNITFVGNTITNTLEGVTIIGDAPHTTIASNTITQAAIWGIQLWSISPKQGTVTGNRVEHSRGIGIFDAYDPGQSFSIGANNSFTSLNGPGIVLLGGGADGREPRPITAAGATVRAKQPVTVWLRLIAYSSSGQTGPARYSIRLTVNNESIAQRNVTVSYGLGVLVRLQGKPMTAGTVGVDIARS